MKAQDLALLEKDRKKMTTEHHGGMQTMLGGEGRVLLFEEVHKVIRVAEPAHIFLHNPFHLLAWLNSEYSTGRVNEGEPKALVMRLKGDLVMLWCQISAEASWEILELWAQILKYWRNRRLLK